MKIWKYEIPIQNRLKIQMPINSVILSFQVQLGKPHIWVLVPNENALFEYRQFILVGTGHEFNRSNNFITYMGTVQIEEFVWHLFEEKFP